MSGCDQDDGDIVRNQHLCLPWSPMRDPTIIGTWKTTPQMFRTSTVRKMQLEKKTAQETRVLRGLTFTIDWFGNRGRPDTFYDGFVYLLLLNDFSCTDQSGTVPMDGKFLVYPASETATLRKKIVLLIGVWRHASISHAGVIGSIWIPNVQNKLFTAIIFLCSFGDPDFVPSFFFGLVLNLAFMQIWVLVCSGAETRNA